LILSTALVTALAAELAVGALLVAPPAVADEVPDPANGPTAPTTETPIRTGRTEDAPPPPPLIDVPEDSAPAVRTGRVGEIPAPDAVPGVIDAPAEDPEAPAVERAPRAHGAPGTKRAPTVGGQQGRRSRPSAGDQQPANQQPANQQPGDQQPDDQQPDDQQSGDTRTGQSGDQQSGETTGASDPPSTSAPGGPSPAMSPGPVPPVPAVPLVHTVIPGDNLWEIAAAHLAATSGRPRSELGALDIAPYWTRVCMVNRPHLVSGDVGLIYAGEVIELPSI
jgi:hypothetical protein